MNSFVKSFRELTPELQNQAGGKGSMLAQMFQRGYPVPDGFIILPSGFEEDKLLDAAWDEVKKYLSFLKNSPGSLRLAVRSSALSEDSAQASFAGEFESLLNVNTDEALYKAIHAVRRSRGSERVKAYSTAQGMDTSHQMSVVVQRMVQAEMAGVLFTADPVTGSHLTMMGNFVYGLGEQLVSGEANAQSFTMMRPHGKYAGPKDLKNYAARLYHLAANLEKDFGCPQDIEWAVANGRVYILQARPITTLRTVNYATYEINESRDGDFLWTKNNVGEALPDVMTPFTWSLLRELDLECQKSPGYYLWSGNICGRVYSNISMSLSVLSKMGISMKTGKKLIGDVFGSIPENIEVPVYPFSRIELLKEISRRAGVNLKRRSDALKNVDQYIQDTQEWCDRQIQQISQSTSSSELLDLWADQIRPYVSKLWAVFLGGASDVTLVTFRNKLVKMVGDQDASLLLSNIRGDSGLESLGPLVGIMQVSRGEMSREDFLARYGHRSPHEFEMYLPYPSEDSAYVGRQLQAYQGAGMDVEALLNRQHEQFSQALERFYQRYPRKKKWVKNKLARMAHSAQLRESIRSEFVKTFRVMRIFMLKLGEMTGIGDNAFFLYTFEVSEVLKGSHAMLKNLSSRKANYARYQTLPALPQYIRGSFDPFIWSKSDNRRLDYYDPHAGISDSVERTMLIKGFSGAAGRIEGKARLLTQFEEGESLIPGEILVTATTNVGWTPLFPRAAAIVTDIGAPLSHAAIVARELGIPAVVGCGNATRLIKTGDRLVVDGGQGIVRIL